MSQPPPYIRYQDFSDYQSANPDTPFPGSIIDTELDRIKTTTDALITNIALIQRDDGLLDNSSVHPDSLNAAVLDMISGWNPRGNWATATAYVNSSTQKDVVLQSGVSYVCLVSHTAGVFATDLAAGKWQTLGQASTAANVTFAPTGGIAATTVQTAIAELDTEKQPLDATLTALAGAATGANKLVYFSGVDTVAVADLTAAGRAILDDADAAAQRTTLGLGTLATKNAVAAGDMDANAVTQANIADDAVGVAELAHGTQGDILYYSTAGAPALLPAGTSGQFLKTQGGGNNPVWAPQALVQSKAIAVGANQDHSAVIPWDNSIPQNTEGSEITSFSIAITPTSASNMLEIEVVVQAHSGAVDSGDATIIALFQDSTASALAAAWAGPGAANDTGKTMVILHRMVAATTSPTTFKVRIGRNSGGVVSVNGIAGSGKLGGVGRSTLVVREVAP